MSDEIILHHYPRSPFAEKVRVAFGVKRLRWHAVEQPRMAPKPDLTPLTGGYRRIPVMQIGADIYCDTRRILRELERRCPAPPLFPRSGGGHAAILAAWADRQLFACALGLVFGLHGDRFPAELHADRASFTAGRFDGWDSAAMRPRVADLRMQLASYLGWLDDALQDGRRFLLGDALSVADLAVYHPLWYARGNLGDEAKLTDHPRLAAWFARIESIGHGEMQPLAAERAIATARAASPQGVATAVDTASGYSAGDRLAVVPTDWGFDPVEGELLGLDRDNISLRRHDAVAGIVHVHFPREGFAVRPAAGR